MTCNPSSQSFRGFLQDNSHLFADGMIGAGVFEFDPLGGVYRQIECPETLSSIREFMIDFLETGCRRRTYLLDAPSARGLPTWQHRSVCYERCYVSFFLVEDGALKWKFTWTPGDLAVEDEILLISLTFRKGLFDWAHATSTSSSPGLPEQPS